MRYPFLFTLLLFLLGLDSLPVLRSTRPPRLESVAYPLPARALPVFACLHHAHRLSAWAAWEPATIPGAAVGCRRTYERTVEGMQPEDSARGKKTARLRQARRSPGAENIKKELLKP